MTSFINGCICTLILNLCTLRPDLEWPETSHKKKKKYLSVCGQSAEKFKCPSWKMKCALSFRKICLSTKNKLVTHFLLGRTQNLENVPWTWYSVTVCRSDRSVQCTLPTAEILNGKNALAWVSMVLYFKKYMKMKILKQKKTGSCLEVAC
jgi:hypothetical protein